MSDTGFEWLTRVSRYMVLAPYQFKAVMRVEKAGQTSIVRRMVQRFSPFPLIEFQTNPAEWQAYCFARNKHEIETYAVVRNPWDRAVSNWKHMVDAGATESGLKAFLENREWESAYDNWVRCRPCSWWTHQGGEQVVDHVLRFEDFDNSARTIGAAFGVPEDVAVPHAKKSEHRPYREYYDDETAELVADLYREDVVNFGYDL